MLSFVFLVYILVLFSLAMNYDLIIRFEILDFPCLKRIYITILSNIFEAHREAKVVDFHLAEVAVLLELVLGVQVVVAVRADTVDLVTVKYANMQYVKYANMQYAKYANMQYAKYANMQYIKFANMQDAVDLGAVKYAKYENM